MLEDGEDDGLQRIEQNDCNAYPTVWKREKAMNAAILCILITGCGSSWHVAAEHELHNGKLGIDTADKYILKSYIQRNTSPFAYASFQLSCMPTPFVCDALCMLFLSLFLQILARHRAQNAIAIHMNVYGFITPCRDTWELLMLTRDRSNTSPARFIPWKAYNNRRFYLRLQRHYLG